MIIALADDGRTAGFVLVDVKEADWSGQRFSSGYIELRSRLERLAQP